MKLFDLVSKHNGSFIIKHKRLKCTFKVYEQDDLFVSVGIDNGTGCFDSDGDEQLVFNITTNTSWYNVILSQATSHKIGIDLMKDNLKEFPELWKEKSVRHKIADMFAISHLLVNP